MNHVLSMRTVTRRHLRVNHTCVTIAFLDRIPALQLASVEGRVNARTFVVFPGRGMRVAQHLWTSIDTTETINAMEAGVSQLWMGHAGDCRPVNVRAMDNE